ncbi:MAG TPA: GMC family oxidoreductase [Pyrinomonadaceae bacterium]
MAGKIVEGRNLNPMQDWTLMPDFCVVGSGAAGGVCALKLAEAGFDVIVLEEGPNIPKVDGKAPGQKRAMLNEREAEMYKLLYQEGGTRLTKNGGVKVMQGRCLGGGTAVNWSACLPPRLETLDEWQKRGLPFTRQNLDKYLREVVNYLPIVRNDKYNTSARKFIEGCDHLGIPHDNLPNNTHNCRECGSCGVGCPYDRKMSGFVKWLPDAIAKGATVYTDTKVDKLVGTADRVTEVHSHFIDGKNRPTGGTLVVKPTKGVVLAAGSIGTPGLLLRSKLDAGKRVGRWTHIHPVTITIGKYPEKTLPAYGVPDNMWSPKFAAGPTGYLVETGSFFPVLSASATLQHGPELHRILGDYYPHGAISYAHHTTGFDDKEPYGTVALDDNGDPELDYVIPKANIKPMQESLEVMCRIHLAAGATSVYVMRNPPLEVRSEADFAEIRKINFAEAQRSTIFTVHVMGGCQMHKDDARRAVNNDFTFRGKKNLWVLDASIFPTALGANPQVTIYALALWGAEEICKQHSAPFKLNHQQGGQWPWPGY